MQDKAGEILITYRTSEKKMDRLDTGAETQHITGMEYTDDPYLHLLTLRSLTIVFTNQYKPTQ